MNWILLVLYVAGFMAASGVAYNRTVTVTECLSRRKPSTELDRVAAGVFAGMLWPLYAGVGALVCIVWLTVRIAAAVTRPLALKVEEEREA